MYQKLTPMLLNEGQRLQKRNDAQLTELTQQQEQLIRQSEELRALQERLARLELKP